MLGLKGSITVAQQKTYSTKNTGGDQVRFSVTVHVRGDDIHGIGTDSEGLLTLERSIAITQKDADQVVGTIGDGQIDLSITVQIRCGNGGVVPAYRDFLFSLKRSVAVAQQNAHAGAGIISRHQIGLAVAIHVGNDNRFGLHANTRGVLRRESRSRRREKQTSLQRLR